jgi:hypothetical protein
MQVHHMEVLMATMELFTLLTPTKVFTSTVVPPLTTQILPKATSK